MKILIVGLGSMGKRRIRNLQTLGERKIIGFDLREDRRTEAEKKYKIKTIESLKNLDLKNIGALVISTPPDRHNEYIKLAIDYKKPAFVEASVILKGLAELNKFAKNKKVLIAPSCTLRFHPAIKKIKEIVKNRKYGRVTNFSYHSGQYLPDWHPWEKLKDFYAGKREIGGAREMVPFELTWIVDILGFPKKTLGFYGETMDIKANVNDTYVISMNFGRAFGSLTIDVTARRAVRNLILNMEKGQILWLWEENFIKLYDASKKKWKKHYFQKGKAAKGYNKNIIEDMYVEEIKTFLGVVKGKDKFPNSLDEDIRVLKLLKKIEKK